MAKEEKIKYVANITLKNKNGKYMTTGTIFYEDDIKPNSFKAFLADGTIFPLDQAEIVTKSIPGMRNLVDGLKVAPALVKKGSQPEVKNIPAVIWDFDPEKIKTISFEILMAMYKSRSCWYSLNKKLPPAATIKERTETKSQGLNPRITLSPPECGPKGPKVSKSKSKSAN